MDCDKKINMAFTVSRRDVAFLMKTFHTLPSLYPDTHCVHLAAIGQAGQILSYAEDIGRHNAVDKVFGKALLEKVPLQDKILLSTGRLTFEVVAKAVRQRIPVLLSRTAPSSAAVTLARKFHMGLVGFIRGSRMNIYSAGWRVT
jgi:FdhD protein